MRNGIAKKKLFVGPAHISAHTWEGSGWRCEEDSNTMPPHTDALNSFCESRPMGKVPLSSLLLLLCFLLPTSAEGASPREEDLVTGLPGQPANVTFRQYAGYVAVDDDVALFYYFVEAEDEPLTHHEPLTLWLNGGPGCSSLGNGAFEELGPFFPNGYGRGLISNHYSWNKASNLLFLESPAGVGFSYSNSTSNTFNDSRTAEDSLKFLLGWFEKFPEYKDRHFYLAGESYAGHYVPQLASLLLDYNDRTKTLTFNLKGVTIGNPLLNLSMDTYSTFSFWWSHGILSDETFFGITNSCNFSGIALATSEQSVTCNRFVNNSNIEVGEYINFYDVELDVCYSPIAQQMLRLNRRVHNISHGVDVCMDSEIEFYLNLPEVQEALHANVTKLSYNWTLCSSHKSLNYTDHDSSIEMQPYLEDILKHGVRLWVYSGDMDSVIPLTGTRTVVKNVAESLKLTKTEPYRAWYHIGQVGGWTVAYGNLTYATVRDAGHMVPMTQPARALLLFRSFISGNPLPTNKGLQKPS